ncbi:MAG: hypothetical protein Kow0099_17060 [Candidatus Abyssubacteria bacterium]
MSIRKKKGNSKRSRWEHIVEAASRVFFEKGYYLATIEDIETESGLTRGSIYYHFKNKDDIYFSVLALGLRLLRDELRWVARTTKGGPEELVLRLLDCYCEFSRAHREYIKILEHFYSGWDSKVGLPEELVEEINRLIFECLQEVVTVLRQGADEGLFAVKDPFVAAVLLWSMIGSALRKTTDNPRAAFLGIEWDTMKTALKDNILKSLQKGTAP